MAENNGGAAPATPEAAPAQPVLPKLQVLGQFVRDMSFENIAAQKAVNGAVQPDIQVQVALDARKREAADQAHRKFADENSDFMGFLKLWAFYEQELKNKKSNRDLLNRCHQHFLSFLRLKELLRTPAAQPILAGGSGPSPEGDRVMHP